MNVARFILDKAVDLFRLESKKTIDTYGKHKQIKQQVQNTASTRTILLNYRIKNFYLQKLDTLTDSLGKPMNGKCTHTT